MSTTTNKKILRLAMQTGELMQKHGAETYRVEDTINRMCSACGVDKVDTFATTTGIFASIDPGKKDDNVYTLVRRIPYIDINLTKISKLNEFSRRFTTTSLSVDDGLKKLDEINKISKYHLLLRAFGAFLIGFCMSPFFGAHILEMVLAGVISGIAYIVSDFFDNLHFYDFIRIFVCASVISLSAFALKLFISDLGVAPIIVGALTVFMPGVRITNATRDLMSAEILSGISRLVEALLFGIALACGVGLAMKLWSLGGIAVLPADPIKHPLWILGICSLGYTVGFSIIFRVAFNRILIASIFSALAMVTSNLLGNYGYDAITAIFFGAMLLALLAEIGARVFKDATTIFILPGIVPFVPGSYIYALMSEIIAGDYTTAMHNASLVGGISGAIAVGIFISATLIKLIFSIKRRIS